MSRKLELLIQPRSEALKRNACAIADDHREHCSGADCTVSLALLADLLALAGIELTDEERSRFL